MATSLIPSFQTAWNVSDADFRTFILSFHNVLTAGGWVQTSDTGQVNTGTVTNPLATVSAGYSMWRSNDATGGLVEIYLRLDFFGKAASSGSIGFKLQVGFASDGAGNLTGIVSTLRNFTGSGQTALSGTLVASCGSGYFLWAYGRSGSTDQVSVSIERTKSNVGQATNDILIYTWAYTGSMTRSNQVLSPTFVYPLGSTLLSVTPTTTNSVKSGVVGLGFVFGQKAGFTNPSINLILSMDRAVGIGPLGQIGDTVSVTSFGSPHTYYVTTSDINGFNFQGAGDGGLLLRYE